MTRDMLLKRASVHKSCHRNTVTYTTSDIKDKAIKMSHFRLVDQFCGIEGFMSSSTFAVAIAFFVPCSASTVRALGDMGVEGTVAPNKSLLDPSMTVLVPFAFLSFFLSFSFLEKKESKEKREKKSGKKLH